MKEYFLKIKCTDRYNYAATIPGGIGGGGGGLGGQQFKRLGDVVKRLDRLGINFAHIMQMNLGMDTGWTNWPHETPGEHFDAGLSRGNVWDLGGQYFIKSLGNAMISRENKLKYIF